MDEGLRQFIRDRASHRCEYCRMLQEAEPFFTYHIEHIVARQHGGDDDDGNLAFAKSANPRNAPGWPVKPLFT